MMAALVNRRLLSSFLLLRLLPGSLSVIKRQDEFDTCGTADVRFDHDPPRAAYQGYEAVRQQFPWTVLISYTHRNTLFRCVGVIVHKRWIVTAGKCIENATANSVFVFAGRVRLHNHDDAGRNSNGRGRRIDRVVIHPEFDEDLILEVTGALAIALGARVGIKELLALTGQQLDTSLFVHIHDIAMLHLTEDLPFESDCTIAPACFPKVHMNLTKTDFNSVKCYLISFSSIGNFTKMYYANVKNMTRCSAFIDFIDSFAGTVTINRYKDIFCFEGREIVCPLDIGSPLICLLENRWHAVGVLSPNFLTSRARTCQGPPHRCCGIFQEDVFMSLGKYAKWITDNIQE